MKSKPKRIAKQSYDSVEGILLSLKSTKKFLLMLQRRREAAVGGEKLSWFLVEGVFELREDGQCLQWKPGLSGIQTELVGKSDFLSQCGRRRENVLLASPDKYVIVPPIILRCPICQHVFRMGDTEDVVRSTQHISLERFTGISLGRMLIRIVNPTGGIYGIPIQANLLNGKDVLRVNLLGDDLGRIVRRGDYLQIDFLSYRHARRVPQSEKCDPVMESSADIALMLDAEINESSGGTSAPEEMRIQDESSEKGVNAKGRRRTRKTLAEGDKDIPKKQRYHPEEGMNGWYNRMVGTFRLLDASEEKALAVRIKGGDVGARNDLVQANLRLAFWSARRFWASHRNNIMMSLDDCVQEANLALLEAGSRFDEEMGFRFSTYAIRYILGKLRVAYADTFNAVSFPRGLHWKFAKFHREMEKFLEAFDRGDALARAAAEAKIPLKSARKYADMYLSGVVSLDAEEETVKGSGRSLLDILTDQACPPEEIVSLENQREVVGEFLGTLGPRQKCVVSGRFGFPDEELRTLGSLGEELGVTRERVRQIEFTATSSLRRKMERQGCRRSDFLGD
ncbi:MAG: sigma-70 family RNA polymerase sigma factor [Candidatus Moraniibacteriota bacterium]